MSQTEVNEESEMDTTVLSATCDECRQVVEGLHWVCVSCSGAVVCGGCVSHGVHPTCYVLRVPPLRPQWEVQALLRAVRQALAMSSFADRLAEPLCDYEIDHDLSEDHTDIKIEKSEDEPHHDLDKSDQHKVKVEVENIKGMIPNSFSKVGSAPLVSASPTKKMSSEQAMVKSQKTHTETISHRDHKNDDVDTRESQAGASKTNKRKRKRKVTGKRGRPLKNQKSTQFDKDKNAKPTTSKLCVKNVMFASVEHVMPIGKKYVTLFNVKQVPSAKYGVRDRLQIPKMKMGIPRLKEVVPLRDLRLATSRKIMKLTPSEISKIKSADLNKTPRKRPPEPTDTAPGHVEIDVSKDNTVTIRNIPEVEIDKNLDHK